MVNPTRSGKSRIWQEQCITSGHSYPPQYLQKPPYSEYACSGYFSKARRIITAEKQNQQVFPIHEPKEATLQGKYSDGERSAIYDKLCRLSGLAPSADILQRLIPCAVF